MTCGRQGVVSVLAWLVLDETLTPIQLVGLAVAVVGVAWPRRPGPDLRRVPQEVGTQ